MLIPMPKSNAEERLEKVVRAATRVFASKGYRRTQMADVAAELGVSAGNLYNYVESKEALFHACLAANSPARHETVGTTLPIATPAPEETEAVVRRGMAVISRRGVLAEALKIDEP